eukprot:9167367-Pyramimonas_sp.AAC.1
MEEMEEMVGAWRRYGAVHGVTMASNGYVKCALQCVVRWNGRVYSRTACWSICGVIWRRREVAWFTAGMRG